MRLRGLAAISIGIVLAILLLRLAIVRANPESTLAGQLWPEHPAVLTSTAMRGVGVAAAAGAKPAGITQRQIQQLIRTAPLAIEPFLVEGALAEKEGATERAQQLYAEARRRDPRSIAAHYLLTGLYLRTGHVPEGIAELAELARLVPASVAQFAPALAQFSRSRGAPDQLRHMFRLNRQLEQPVLAILAADPQNADLILSVADTRTHASDTSPAWQEKLLDGMIALGDYRRAYSVWRRLVGLKSDIQVGLFNPAFHQTNAPPPFNWSFVSAGAGVAEPESGSLRVLFYGRDNAVLVRETIILAPGRYRLSQSVSIASGNPGDLAWVVLCLPDRKQILSLRFAAAGAKQTLAGEFEVPARGCDAQEIMLRGTVEDLPETVDLEIGSLALQRMGP